LALAIDTDPAYAAFQAERSLQFQSQPPFAMTKATPPQAGNAARQHSAAALEPRKAGPVTLDQKLQPAQAFAAIAHECARQLAANTQGALLDENPEFVHQMRVALRRLRSALRLFHPYLPAPFVRDVKPELRWLATQLGEVRDWDVLIGETLPRLLRAQPEARPGRTEHAIAVAAKVRRDAAARPMHRALRSRRFAALLSELARVLALLQLDGAVAAKKLPRLSALAVHKLQKANARLRFKPRESQGMTPDARHQVRIDAKRLRYAVEFFSSLYAPKAAARYAERLAALQGALGTLNDHAVAADLLASLRLPPPTAARVQGKLLEQHQAWLDAGARAHKKFRRAQAFWHQKAR
jgi:CHAD domain-containing protein